MTAQFDCFITRKTNKAMPIELVAKSAWPGWLKRQNKFTTNWIKTRDIKGMAADVVMLPDVTGNLKKVVACYDQDDVWALAEIAAKIPAGIYILDVAFDMAITYRFALAWGLHYYRFDQYKTVSRKKDNVPQLQLDKNINKRLYAELQAIYIARDLINMPANDLGPAELAVAVKTVADELGAVTRIVTGDELISEYPAVYAVGKGSARPPVYIDVAWGDATAPRVTVIGKGVVFDTGGYDIKLSSGMITMKKDMGGAAHALALAQLIMAAQLPVRLRLLIPTAENSISGSAFRPSDVINTRKGLTVEIGNTDAEGRLMLADALADADSENPDIIIDFATLTGAARVALGPDLPAVFCTNDKIADELYQASVAISDPLWRLPLWPGYIKDLNSNIADTNNVASGGLGGAIIAALFLQKFVAPDRNWIHIDTFAWNQSNRAGKPAGGDVLGMRAVFHWLEQRYARSQD